MEAKWQEGLGNRRHCISTDQISLRLSKAKVLLGKQVNLYPTQGDTRKVDLLQNRMKCKLLVNAIHWDKPDGSWQWLMGVKLYIFLIFGIKGSTIILHRANRIYWPWIIMCPVYDPPSYWYVAINKKCLLLVKMATGDGCRPFFLEVFWSQKYVSP